MTAPAIEIALVPDGRGEPSRGTRLVTVTAALLPVAILPRELGLGYFSMAPVLTVLGLLVSYRLHLFRDAKIAGFEVALAALGFWSIARLTLLTYLDGSSVDAGLLTREAGLYLMCLVFFRLGRREDLRAPIVRGLLIGFAFLLLLEAYQFHLGITTLLARGYTTDNGYTYATEAGGFRPFGTFTGPATFGPYLAMVGLFLVFTVERRRSKLIVVLASIVGVLVTDTRAAYLGVAFALLFSLFLIPAVRRVFSVVGAPAILVGILVVISNPGIFTAPLARLDTITSSQDVSRETRLATWIAVMHAVNDQQVWPIGFGAGDWATIMRPEIGNGVLLGHAHSNFFQEVFRYGYVGAALFSVWVAVAVWTTWRSGRAWRLVGAAAFMAVVVFIADSLFDNSLSSTNFMLTFALLVGVGQRISRGLTAADSRPDSGPIGLANGGVVVPGPALHGT